MRLITPASPLTLAEVRAEMDRLVAMRNRRGSFHPAEYWRWQDLGRLEASLLGIERHGALRRDGMSAAL